MTPWDFCAVSGLIAWAWIIKDGVQRVARAWQGLRYRLRWAFWGWKQPRVSVSRERLR